MSAPSTAAVAWQLERTSLVVIWDRGEEPVDWIAASTNTFVTGLTELLDLPRLRDAYRNLWPVDEEEQRRFVHANPVTYEDEIHRERGYSVWLYGVEGSPRLNIDAGGPRGEGGRIPLHRAGLNFDPRYTPTPPRETIDDLVALAVRAWQPLLVCWTTTDVVQASGRHGWGVRAGYRVWISTDVGTVTETADGITARPLEGGTLITAPDEWDALRVAHAVNATLDANGLHDIRRSPEHPTP